MAKTTQVFGVTNDMIDTYVERPKVDELFQSGLERNKHIVIYGASKQGKTSLTARHLDEQDYIKINCSPSSQSQDIYNSIVRQLNIEILESREVSIETGKEVKTSLLSKIKIPLFGETEGSIEGALNKNNADRKNWKTIEYNLALAQDLSELLHAIKFKRKIILENFHYLDEEVQKQLSIDLRIFEDYKIHFIILGIWREKNRLIQFNGDLTDRIIEVPVEPWEVKDLKEIIEIGSSILNVNFNKIENRLIESCFDSVGVFQELCKECCLVAGVTETVEDTIALTEEHLNQAINKKMEDYGSRHLRCIESFIEQKAKSSDETPLYIPYYFVKILIKEDFVEISKGLKRRFIQEKIKELHHRPDDVRPSDMGYFLRNLVSSQIRKSISPPLFDFDISTNSVKIIDSTFYFFLKNCNREELEDNLQVPIGLEYN